MTLFSIAVGGRVALQFVPSVEPIIPLAVLAGLLWGARDGFSLGAGAYVTSNFFVWGFQGPWTVFQALGAGLAGALAGTLVKKTKENARDLVVWSMIGTLVFECMVNLGGVFWGTSLILGAISLPGYFLLSLPFSLVHFGTNVVFARLLEPFFGWKEDAHAIDVLAYSRRDPRTGMATDIRLYRKTGP